MTALYLTGRILAVVLAVICICAAAGISYQSLSETADLGRYPPPGRLIDIGGRKLHLLCAGRTTAPTVVIEAGSGNDSTFWHDILRGVSSFAHVCAYDRAGLGWSDPATGPLTFDDRAADLHSLLVRADIAGPYILVGHSYGGYIVRRFAAAYPENVSGIVLIDAPDEEWSFAPEGLCDAASIGAQEWRLGWAARLGLLRLGVALFPGRFDPMKDVPPAVHAELLALYLRSARHFAVANEMAAYNRVPSAWRRRNGFGLLGNIPLVVVSRAAQDPVTGEATYPEWQQAQDRLTALSTNSVHLIAGKSGHMIQFTEPEVIVTAIHRLVAGGRIDTR